MNKTKHINLSVEKMSAVYKVGKRWWNEKGRTILERVDIFFLSIGIIMLFFGRFIVACELHNKTFSSEKLSTLFSIFIVNCLVKKLT
jgi:hypothetical protein